MPTFNAYEEERIDIDVDDFISECDDMEIEEIIQILKDNGDIEPCTCERLEQISNIVKITEWDTITKKLMDNKHQLTNEEETIIFNIANRLI